MPIHEPHIQESFMQHWLSPSSDPSGGTEPGAGSKEQGLREPALLSAWVITRETTTRPSGTKAVEDSVRDLGWVLTNSDL